MSLSQRARTLQAVAENYPAEDVLHFVQPKYYLPALCEAVNAYNSQAARGGLEFADSLQGGRISPAQRRPGKPARALRVRPTLLRRIARLAYWEKF